MEQTDFSNGIEAQTYFDKLIKSLWGVKIVSVFSRCPSFSAHGSLALYRTEEISLEYDSLEMVDIKYVKGGYTFCRRCRLCG